VAALRRVHDPEIPINLHELGLIYELQIGAGGEVSIRMTLTTPSCPVADALPGQVRAAVREVDGGESRGGGAYVGSAVAA
jgi:metal-sulfur cluster biosynthetic enzyme